MATDHTQDASTILERLAGEMHAAAFDFAEPAVCYLASEQRIENVNRICAEARAAVRTEADPEYSKDAH